MGSNYTYGCGSNFKIPETTEAADDRTQTSYQKNKRMKMDFNNSMVAQ